MTKFHLSLNVQDLGRSVDFYRRLLGIEPAKLHEDYAKFELEQPPVVLALEPTPGGSGSRLSHIGLRYESHEKLMEAVNQVYGKGLAAQFLQGVECCHSRQSKAILSDPDETLVELYVLEDDSDGQGKGAAKAGAGAGAAGGPAARPTAWEHLLGQPFPDVIDLPDAAVDEVRLRGTFNAAVDGARQDRILAEARRVLRPGGHLTLHLLVSDRTVAGPLPKLPGPAANVDWTPVGEDVAQAIERAGFGSLLIKRLSHAAVFRAKDAEMRELLVTATKRPEAADGPPVSVVYKGPFRSVTDDFGTVYRRGVTTGVPPHVFAALRESELAGQFAFLTSGGGCQ